MAVTRIFGIDPGSVRTGIGIVELDRITTRHLHHTVIETGGGELPARLKVIFDAVSELIHEYQPDEVAVETVFMRNNADSALKLGQARGAAICAAMAMSRSVAEYGPRQVKQAIVGRGVAEKQQVQHMIGVLLGIDGRIPEDAADALGIAVTHAHHLQTAQRLDANGARAAVLAQARRRR
ncbi:MAG: crossover junction endodeoxyribonuclease RuvC [Pseudomonadota bacterium]